MTTTDLPAWLSVGSAAVYFPRRRTELAEAWPVSRVRVTAATVAVSTEQGDINFRRVDLRAMGAAHAGPFTPLLLPLSDDRVTAAHRRTEMMRAVDRLTRAIAQNRPTHIQQPEAIAEGIAAIAAAAVLAYGDVVALVKDAS
jgi:hypothetical protein